jgi:hypothetical protein
MSCGCNGPMVGGKRKKNRRGTRKMRGGWNFFGFGDSNTNENCRKWYQVWKRDIPPCQTEQTEQPALPALPAQIGGSGCVYSSENRQYKKSKSKKSKKSRKSTKSRKSRK